MITFISIVFFIIILRIFYEVYKRNLFRIFVSHPLLLSSIFFTIIHLFLPVLQWNSGFFRYQKSYDIDIYFYSIGFTFLCFLFLIAGFFLNFNQIKQFPNKLATVKRNRVYERINFIMIFIIFCVAGYTVYSNITNILSIGVEEYMQDRVTLETGNGLINTLAHWIYMSTIMFFFYYLVVRNKTIKIASLLFFMVSLGLAYTYYSYNSNRNSLFLLILNLGVTFFVFSKNFLKIKQLSFKQKSFIIISILLSYSIFEYQGKVRKEAQWGGDKTVEFGFVESINGAFGNHENIVWLFQNKNELYYGVTYLSGITTFVPRSIWPSKPLSAGPRLKNQIMPGSYVVGRKGNSSLTTGLFTELLMNFGVLGSFVFSFFYGMLLKWLFNYYRNSTNPFKIFYFLFLVVLLSSQMYYAEFTGFLTRTMITLIPLFIFYKFNNKNKLLE